MREHARHIAHARQAELPWPLTKAAPKPLLHIKEVFWQGDKGPPVSLLDYLLDLPWKRRCPSGRRTAGPLRGTGAVRRDRFRVTW